MSGASSSQDVAKGVSLYADAWRRLKKNKMAMIGLWVVVVMSLLSILAPAIAPFEANYEFLWIRAQPFGYTHPDVLVKNEMRVGEFAEVPDSCVGATRLRFDILPVDERKHRLLKSDDDEVIGAIIASGLGIQALETHAADQYLLHRSAGVRTLLRERRLAVGDPWPAAFGADSSVAIVLLGIPQGAPQVVEAELKAGKVISLVRDGQPLDRIAFDGRNVTATLADGAPQVLRHLLGTDMKGRDVLSRTLYGGRISLLVGVVATIVSLLIGVVYGAVSGYFGGKIDMLLMATVDVLYGIPYMFLVILLMVSFGQDIIVLFIALGCVQWLTMARIVRGQILSLKQKEFVEAARMSGTTHLGILFKHLVPNTLGVIVVYTTLTVPSVILQESFLAFIGLTVEYQGESLESWGALVNNGVKALGSGGANAWLLLVPSIAMAATLFSLNFLGDGLRDALDPQQRGRT